MKLLSAEIEKLPHVRKDPIYEKRKQLFFSGPKADAESDIYYDVLKKISHYQFKENNLEYLKGMKKAKEQVEIAQRLKEKRSS